MLSVLIFVPAGLTAGSFPGLPSERYAGVKPEIAKPPGRMVHIGTHRLHIWCLGEGRPSIVLDSGVGGFSLEWTKIETDLAPEFRVCSYDRAGYGWSDPGPVPRTTARIVEELHTLLSRAAVPGPYVLVGHSFGGYNMLRFAKKYPQEAAGLVLVDSSHPKQFRYFPSASRQLRGASSARGASRLFSRALLPDNYPFRER
ncbi:MAG: alpha/beta fold hydrolase, partial [Gammaproteobacteria bacterium]